MQNALPPRALLGTSAAILELQADTRLAEQCDAQVLITGEQGVGKRALALLIHSRSDRATNAFKSVDVAGISDSELGATLFGRNGSPNAPPRQGSLLHAAAPRGTLFINGIDAISHAMQERLSAFLEPHDDPRSAVENDWDAFDVRIIGGAPPRLFERVHAGEFRQELFYRLNVIHLIVPPLRARLDDLPKHLRDCIAAYAQREGTVPPEIAPETLDELRAYGWPGNDRELDQLARLLVKRGPATIRPRDLPPEMTKHE